ALMGGQSSAGGGAGSVRLRRQVGVGAPFARAQASGALARSRSSPVSPATNRSDVSARTDRRGLGAFARGGCCPRNGIRYAGSPPRYAASPPPSRSQHTPVTQPAHPRYAASTPPLNGVRALTGSAPLSAIARRRGAPGGASRAGARAHPSTRPP